MLYQQKTFLPKKEELQLTWLQFDAEGKILGRLASEIAKVLRGKHKPTYTPHLKVGDGVIVINADKVAVSGRKEAQKEYFDHSGYPGGQKRTTFRCMRDRHPEEILRRAVWGMLPHNRLGRSLMKRLRIFASKSHTMPAQQSIVVNI